MLAPLSDKSMPFAGTRSVSRPFGHNLHGLPAQIVTRGYHIGALPSLRARGKVAIDWLEPACLGDDFVRVGLGASTDGTLGAIDAQVAYLTAAEAKAAARDLPATPT